MMKNKLFFGCHKSPYDKRDYLVKGFLKKEKVTLPLEYDLTSKQSPVRNQGSRGSCAGFAGAACKEYQEKIDYDRLILLSPEYIYSNAQIESGHVGQEGTTIRAVMKVLTQRGVCEEKYWPYEIPRGERHPKADEDAKRYKIKVYAKVLNLRELKESLVKFGTLVAGIYVFKSIYKVKEDGVVPTPNTMWPSNWKPLGGHAIAICGYSDIAEFVKFKNSWGDWGKNGFGYLSYEYIKDHMVDCYSMVDIDDPMPYMRTMETLSPYEGSVSWV